MQSFKQTLMVLSFERIMKAGKIGVNWDMCIVREHFSIMRCHKCCGFDHTKETCTKNTTCGYCGESHPSTECQATQMSCISCMNANEKMSLSLDVNHPCMNMEQKMPNINQENKKHRRKS